MPAHSLGNARVYQDLSRRSCAPPLSPRRYRAASTKPVRSTHKATRWYLRGSGNLQAELQGSLSKLKSSLGTGRPLSAKHVAASKYLARIGASGYGCTFAAMVAFALYALGRHDEAAHFAELSRELAEESDVLAQVNWRQAMAKVMARRGDAVEALRLAREAVALMEQTDGLNHAGDALVDLAEVLNLVGQPDESAERLKSALRLYEQKENLVSAAKVRELLIAVDNSH